MNKYVELIKAEIERRINDIADLGDRGVTRVQELSTLCDMEDFINSLPEDEPSEDLEQEIRNYNVPFNDWERLTRNTLEVIALHFAQWQKKQMQKGAVEGLVCSDLENINYVRTTGKIPSDFYFGEKVKLIIVKEEKI